MEIPHGLLKLVPVGFLSGMLRGTCFVASGLASTWAYTISWSERPGITVISSTRVGLVVKNRSSMF